MHSKVAKAKINRFLYFARGDSPSKGGSKPRLSVVTTLPFESPLLLHCVNSALPENIKSGSKVFMSEGKNGRALIAHVRSVESADYRKAPYRSYGDAWESFMHNCNRALPALVFK